MSPRSSPNGKTKALSRFPQNLRHLRGSLSQGEFAESLLVCQQTLSFWENGRRRPNPRTWLVLEQILGYTREQLEQEDLARQMDRVAEDHRRGRTIALPSIHQGAALRIGLEDLAAEAMSMSEIQRALREALRDQRPIWLVVGEKPKRSR